MVDAREYLSYFRVAESRIRLKIKQIQSLQDRLLTLSSSLDQEHVTHTKNVTLMAETVAIITDMQRDIDQQTSEIFQRKREAFQLLDQVKPENATILIERYFDGKTVQAICQMIHVTKRQAQRRINEAIEELQGILNSGEQN